MKRVLVIADSGADGTRGASLESALRAMGTPAIERVAPADVTETALASSQAVIIGEACGLDATAKRLARWVHAGGTLVAFANAAACTDETYISMLGARSTGIAPATQFNVNISDRVHPITRGFQDCHVHDRFIFLTRAGEGDWHWLLSGNWQGQLLPLAYARQYGRGHVFYAALGTEAESYTHPAFVRMLRRAAMWGAGAIKPGPVRCGIVGYGGAFSMGKCHADAILATTGLQLTAICDTNPQRVEEARKVHAGWDGFIFTDLRKFIDARVADVAIVVTPHNTHAPVTLDLLAGGIGVVCEKPFCISIDEATRMINAARSNHLLLTAFHNRRWDGDFLTLRQIVQRGLLGDLFHVEVYRGEYRHPGYWWRSDKTISGGGAYDWGAHFIDWVLNLMPYRMESVTGFLSKRQWHDVTNEDHCEIVIRFEGGRVGHIELSNLAATGKKKWRLLGTRGGLVGDWDSPAHVTTYRNSSTPEKVEIPYAPQRWPADFYNNLADHLLTDEPLAVTPESARRVIAVLELAERSSQSGQAEAVPFE